MKNLLKNHLAPLIIALGALLIASPFASAASVTWNNAGTDFNTAANWTGGLPGTGDNAAFSGAASIQPDLSANITIDGLTFSSADASGYVLSRTAGALTLTNVGTGASSAINATNTSGTNTISAPIILGGAAGTTATFTQEVGGTLNISGNISSTNAISGLSLLATANVGTFTLSGSNTYAGDTTLQGNSKTSLNINNAHAISSGDLIAISTTSINNTSGAAITLANNNNLSIAATLHFGGSDDLSFGSGVLTLTGSGEKVVNVNGSAGTTMTVGSVDAVSTSAVLRKGGIGILVITGAAGANFQGGVNLNVGTLVIGNKTSLGTGILSVKGSTTLSASADLSGANAVANAVLMTNNLAIGGSNNLTLSGNISQGDGNRIITITNTATTALLDVANSYSGATRVMDGAGILEVTKLADGGVNSSIGASANTAANLSIGNGSTLRYVGSGDSTDRLFTINGAAGTVATLDASGSGAVHFTNSGGLSHSSSNQTRTLNLTGTNTGNNALAISLANNGVGALSVTKNGTGTWALSGTSTYTGGTTVNAGTLIISGGISDSSAVTVNAGGRLAYNGTAARTGSVTLNGSGNSNRAVLAGTGALNVAVTLNDLGDTLSPGNSPGVQTYGVSQSWDSFTYLWETNDFTGTTAGTDFDQIAITGSLALGAGGFQLDLHSLTAGNVAGNVPNFSELNTSWTILTTTTGITGFNPGDWTILTSDFTSSPSWTGTWSLTQSGNDLLLNYTSAIPEPTTLGLLVMALAVGAAFGKRHRSSTLRD